MDEYLKTLLEQIRCKPARNMVERELRSHIEEQAAENRANGMSEEQALAEAVRDMGDPVETGISLDRIHRPQMAWGMVILVAVISFLSIVLQGFIGFSNPEFGWNYVMRHTISVIFGFVLMLVIYRLDYSFVGKYAKGIAFVYNFILFFSIVFAGEAVNGAVLWLNMGSFHISLSTLMYLYVPLYTGILYRYHGTGYGGIFKSILWMLFPTFLAIRMPSLSLAVLIFFFMAVLLSIAVSKGWFRISAKKFLIVFWGMIIILPVLILKAAMEYGWLAEYQAARLETYLHPELRVYSWLSQSLKQVISGVHLFGGGSEIVKGLPDYNSDYVLVFISSYYGAAAAVIVVSLVLFMAGKIFSIAFRQKNQLGMLMGFACGLIFLVSTIFNLWICSGNLPITLSFLPFFSYGSSNMFLSYILMGIVLSIYRYKNILQSNFRPFFAHPSKTML